ncbi:MAG TPA: acetate/propionate family kinase, partial [Thermomicrobiales bacterium]|nr:acetate/propionate family kinase [Thermomicrobiales bacterium]
EWALKQFADADLLGDIAATGHRIVHGGSRHNAPELISSEVVEDLRALVPIDPEHLPQAIAAIEVISNQLSDVPQIALFDTHFHDTMPLVAKALPLPQSVTQEGVRRFGFHGLSYESTMHHLMRNERSRAEGRLIIAHLGAGASMAAVHHGQSVDTTMGFTPTGGLMMGTRPGDLDPGLLLYLLQVRAMSPEQVSDLLNKQSGLLGVSGTSQDMRDLLAAESADPAASLAIDLFCHIASKHLAGLTASLGGLNTLVFTGGIGEHSPAIRARICRPLGYLGVTLDTAANDRSDAVISAPDGRVHVAVIHADEEATIARQTLPFVAIAGGPHAAL